MSIKNSKISRVNEDIKIVKNILKINKLYSVNNIPLTECWRDLSRYELLALQFEVTEQHVLEKCHKLWNEGNEQNAYDYFLRFEKLFATKINCASSIVKLYPEYWVAFFGDIYPLENIDPIELALCYSQEKLEIIEQLISNHNKRITPGKHEKLDITDQLISQYLKDTSDKHEKSEIIEQQHISRQNNNQDKLNVIRDIRLLCGKNDLWNTKINLKLKDEQLVNQYTLVGLKNIRSNISLEKEKEDKKRYDLALKLYELTEAENINFIHKPFFFDFESNSFNTLRLNYNSKELQEAIDEVQSLESIIEPKPLITEVAEQIFLIAKEKGIKVLREPFHINFDLDDVEDIINNFPDSEIHKALKEINKFESTIQNKGEMYNTLEAARKYLNGRVDEVRELDWRSYAPMVIASEIIGLPIQDAYDIVLKSSKDKSLPEKDFELVMDYRFELERLIFGDRSTVEDPSQFEEYKEYPFEQYVRSTVEAIILPHIEVLEKIEKTNGQIQFVDIWSEHFSEGLKKKVLERDYYKCVVCDEETHLHVHHKVPRKYGGVNHMDNLVTLCASCHGAIETADFEHAYRKCMLNAIKSKTSLQKVHVDTSKDIYLLKEEVKAELDNIFVALNIRELELSQQLLATMKKISYIFES